jgi:glutamate-1-semialdehyde 2,1-aminomutase
MLGALGARTLRNDGDGVYSLPHELEIKAAEAVLTHVSKWAEWARFTRTGSEATHAAWCAAKAATNRPHVIAMEGAYHGWHECWSNQVRRVPYGSDPRTWFDGFWARLRCRLRGRIPVTPKTTAAVFIEPARWQETNWLWLHGARAFTKESGILLVFDSMIYGGRFALGGASEWFQCEPDMETFGKAFGGGKAVAFVVGKERTKRHAEIASGTYSGGTEGLRAVVDTIEEYTTQPVISTLWNRGQQLAVGLDALVDSRRDLLAAREGAPVHQRLRFHKSDDGEVFARLMWDRGVLWHPGCVNVMYAHTPEQIDTVIAAAKDSLEAMR